MVDASSAIVADAVRVGARPHRHVEERGHVLDGIIETTGLLDSGAATEVDESARHRGRAAPSSGALEHEDVGAGRGGLDRRGRTGDAVPRDHDIGFEIPTLDLLERLGVDVGIDRHIRIAAGGSPIHW